jgi:hypothetical protein
LAEAEVAGFDETGLRVAGRRRASTVLSPRGVDSFLGNSYALCGVALLLLGDYEFHRRTRS